MRRDAEKPGSLLEAEPLDANTAGRDVGKSSHRLDRLPEWPFERILASHGDVSGHGGCEVLVRGYRWLLEAA